MYSYKDELAMCYGDKEKLKESLKARIERYNNAPQTDKVKERLGRLKGMLKEVNADIYGYQ